VDELQTLLNFAENSDNKENIVYALSEIAMTELLEREIASTGGRKSGNYFNLLARRIATAYISEWGSYFLLLLPSCTRLQTLTESEQNAIASIILEEIEDERRWDDSFSTNHRPRTVGAVCGGADGSLPRSRRSFFRCFWLEEATGCNDYRNYNPSFNPGREKTEDDSYFPQNREFPDRDERKCKFP